MTLQSLYKNSTTLSALLLFAFIPIKSTIQFAQAFGITIDASSNLIVSGLITDMNNNTTINLVRYNSSGIIDLSFGSQGITSISAGSAPSVGNVVLSGTNITVVGGGTISSSPEEQIIAQYNSSGILNTSFGTAGIGIVTQLIDDASIANAVVIQPDSSIVVNGIALLSGQVEAVVSRYTSSGILDTGFGTGGTGIVRTIIGSLPETHAVQLDQNNKIVTCGTTSISSSSEFLITRYTTTGDLDTTFNSVGYVTIDVGTNPSCTSLAIDSSNNIVAGGQSGNNFCLVRLLPDGSPDTSFGPTGANGIVITAIANSDIIESIAIQSDGKIVAAGSANNFITLARYNTDGSLDTGFGIAGIVQTQTGQFSSAQAVLIQPDGNIVIAGSNDTSFVIARYNSSDGSLDTSFGNNGIVTQPGAISGPTGLVDGNIDPNAAIQYSKLNLAGSIVDNDISATAAIADSKLSTIQTSGKVANSATTATDANVANTIVSRNALGNITVNKVFGNVVGYATSDVNRYGDNIPGTITFPVTSATGHQQFCLTIVQMLDSFLLRLIPFLLQPMALNALRLLLLVN